MKRRRFLKMMGAAPVAAPAMAKEAATQMYQQAGLKTIAGASIAGSGVGWETPDVFPGNGDRKEHWRRRLFKLATKSVERRNYDRLRTPVHALDPDLVANRSFSLGAKIRIQRDRNFERNEAEEKSRLEKMIAGWFDD